jgi:hypothetical protein
MIGTHSTLDGESEGKHNLEYLGLGKRIIFKFILVKLDHKHMDSDSLAV